LRLFTSKRAVSLVALAAAVVLSTGSPAFAYTYTTGNATSGQAASALSSWSAHASIDASLNFSVDASFSDPNTGLGYSAASGDAWGTTTTDLSAGTYDVTMTITGVNASLVTTGRAWGSVGLVVVTSAACHAEVIVLCRTSYSSVHILEVSTQEQAAGNGVSESVTNGTFTAHATIDIGHDATITMTPTVSADGLSGPLVTNAPPGLHAAGTSTAAMSGTIASVVVTPV
jgi:hypothetical protein